MAGAWNRTGTVAVTNGSPTVTGTTTLFQQSRAGDPIYIGTDPIPYEILSITSNTVLTLATNYTGVTGSGKAVTIPPLGINWSSTSQVSFDVARVLARIPAPSTLDAGKVATVNVQGVYAPDDPAVPTSRTAVNNANYTALATDEVVAYTAISAARTVTLPAASAYPVGKALVIMDESGGCSATNTITITRAGSDTIDGLTSEIISTAYGARILYSNGANKWTEAGLSVPLPVPLAQGGTGATTAAAALTNLGLPGLQRVEFSIADDAVATLAVGNLMGALLQFFGNSTAVPRGLVFVRGGLGLNQISSTAVTGAVGLHTTALTGTTGTDGQMNIGIAGTSGNHTLYLENRVGFTAVARAWILP